MPWKLFVFNLRADINYVHVAIKKKKVPAFKLRNL